MMLRAVEELLARHIGLAVESVGRELITRAVQERQASSGALDAGAYWALVTSSPAELQALIEAVVVPETWFFRDPEAFATLTREAVGPWAAAHPGEVMRVLSLPCASGEEPYSIAMAFEDAGFSSERRAIDGVDISEQALARARRGVYRTNAFRGHDLDFRDRHFVVEAEGYRIRDECRAAVSFRAGNLLDADATLRAADYAAVFCRNVLIYLDHRAQLRALEVLFRLLAPGGLLFVGPSETNLLHNSDFAQLKVPLAFAFRKLGKGGRSAPKTPQPRTLPALLELGVKAPVPALAGGGPTALSRKRRRSSPAAGRAGTHSPARGGKLAHRDVGSGFGASSGQAEPLDAEGHLALVARLADGGQLAEASRRCADHERLHGPSAPLFYLMGLLREAADEPDEAAVLHKKALYLDPQHEEALTHLALLLDKRGDVAGAERLRRRARRLPSKAGA